MDEASDFLRYVVGSAIERGILSGLRRDYLPDVSSLHLFERPMKVLTARPHHATLRTKAEPSKPKTPGYDSRLAWHLAELSHLTYHQPEEIAQKTKSWGFKSFEFFDRGGTQAFLVANDQTIVIAFRGTEIKSVADLMTNGDCSRTRACGGRVHEGFWKSSQEIWGDLETAIQRLRHREQTLWLTGHSLGGALATLAGAQFQHCGHDVTGIYSFGCPRIGDRQFALQYNRRLYDYTFRLVNHRDIVPHLPPTELGYTHVGQLIYFDQTGMQSAFPVAQDEGGPKLVEAVLDHDMNAYKSSLKKTMQG